MATGIIIQMGFAEAQSGGFLFPTCVFTPDHFGVQQNRNPSIIALPNQNAQNRGHVGHGTGVPKNILIDFGLMEETLTIDGKMPDEDMSQTQNDILSFMSRLRTNWVTTPTVLKYNNIDTGIGLIKVQLLATNPGGIPAYQMNWACTSLKSNFDRQAGESFWAYKLTLGVVLFPEQSGSGFVS